MPESPHFLTPPNLGQVLSVIGLATFGYAAVEKLYKDRLEEQEESLERSNQQALERLRNSDSEDRDIFLRGLSGRDYDEYLSQGRVLSNAIRQLGATEAIAMLESSTQEELFKQHKANSGTPPSPFVSVTTDPEIAIRFATSGPDPSGKVMIIGTERAVLNPFNSALSESLIEYGILKFEVIGVVDAGSLKP